MKQPASKLAERGIPVIGHVGLTPQAANVLGGYGARGRSGEEAEKILRDARAICDNLREVQQTLTGELREVREELRELTRQVRVAAATLDPIVPSVLRAQRMVQLLWRPSYRAARFLYRVLHRGSGRSQPTP